jgi:hypothetical protein
VHRAPEKRPGTRARELHRIPVNSIELNVALAGSGPYVLLLHGFPHTWELCSHADPNTLSRPSQRPPSGRTSRTHRAGWSPSKRTAQRWSAGKPGACRSGAPSQPAAMNAMAYSSAALLGK